MSPEGKGPIVRRDSGEVSATGDSEVFGPVVTQGYPLRPPTVEAMGKRTPVHDPRKCTGTGACAEVCPVQAITVEGSGRGARFRLDYGRCVFCRACVDVCPSGALHADPFFEMAVRDRKDLVVEDVAGSPPTSPTLPPVEETARRVRELFGGSLAVREVDAGSCNGCEVEVGALAWPRYDLERLGIHFVASPRHADALLVTGPVTANMRLALEKTFRAAPSPKIVIAVGACALSGGPFRGSPEVSDGATSSVPVTVWVPGCPPRPEALLYAFWLALGKVEQRVRMGHFRTGSG